MLIRILRKIVVSLLDLTDLTDYCLDKHINEKK